MLIHMNKFIIAALMLLLPGVAAAATDYYLEVEGVPGEARGSGEVKTRGDGSVDDSQPGTTRASTETNATATVEVKRRGDGSVDDSQPGASGAVRSNSSSNESAGIEPDEIDVRSERATNFGILLGGSDDSEERKRGLERAEEVLLENARASDQAIQSIAINAERVMARVETRVRLFGFLPATTTAAVEINAEGDVTVKFPWWAILASGKDETLGVRVAATLTNVLKTKHETVKNAISNIR